MKFMFIGAAASVVLMSALSYAEQQCFIDALGENTMLKRYVDHHR